MAYAVLKALAFIDKCSDEFSGVDLAGTHGHELMTVFREILFYQCLGIVDLSHGGYCVEPQMRTDQQRLRIGITDAAYTDISDHVPEVILKAGAEGSVGDGMDLTDPSFFLAPDCQTCIAGAEMTVIVCAEKDVEHNVAV